MDCAPGFRSLCNKKATCALAMQPDPSGSCRAQADPEVLQLLSSVQESCSLSAARAVLSRDAAAVRKPNSTIPFAQPINFLEFPNCAGVCAALSEFNIYFAQWHCAGYY